MARYGVPQPPGRTRDFPSPCTETFTWFLMVLRFTAWLRASKHVASRLSSTGVRGVAAKRSYMVLAALLMPGCSGGVKSDQAAEIEGFGPLRFGMSFEEVLTAAPIGTFNPAAIADCADTMALRGCLLTQRTGQQFDVIHASIPYKFAAKIGRDNKLYDITLWFEPEAKLSREECVRMLEATVDWSWPGEVRTTTKLKLSDDYKWHTSPKGVRFPISQKGDFATVFMPEDRGGVARSYFASFLTIAGKPDCSLSVSFSVPTDAPRIDVER